MIIDNIKNTNLEQVEKAIDELQAGRRVVSIAHGSTEVKYAEVHLQELLTLRRNLRNEIKGKEKRRIVFATSKGID